MENSHFRHWTVPLKTHFDAPADMSVMRKMLPNKICWCCVEFDPGIKVVMALTMLLRFISMVIGCFYGPYLYLVLPLGGLYLAADALLFYAVNTALKAFRQVGYKFSS